MAKNPLIESLEAWDRERAGVHADALDVVLGMAHGYVSLLTGGPDLLAALSPDGGDVARLLNANRGRVEFLAAQFRRGWD